MLTLSTPIPVPNLTRLRIRMIDFDEDSLTANVHVEAIGAGGAVYDTSPFILEVRDGTTVGLRPTVSPSRFLDRIQRFTLSTPNGFTNLLTAYVGASIAARNRAAEAQGVTAGWLPGGSVS